MFGMWPPAPAPPLVAPPPVTPPVPGLPVAPGVENLQPVASAAIASTRLCHPKIRPGVCMVKSRNDYEARRASDVQSRDCSPAAAQPMRVAWRPQPQDQRRSDAGSPAGAVGLRGRRADRQVNGCRSPSPRDDEPPAGAVWKRQVRVEERDVDAPRSVHRPDLDPT